MTASVCDVPFTRTCKQAPLEFMLYISFDVLVADSAGQRGRLVVVFMVVDLAEKLAFCV